MEHSGGLVFGAGVFVKVVNTVSRPAVVFLFEFLSKSNISYKDHSFVGIRRDRCIFKLNQNKKGHLWGKFLFKKSVYVPQWFALGPKPYVC